MELTIRVNVENYAAALQLLGCACVLLEPPSVPLCRFTGVCMGLLKIAKDNQRQPGHLFSGLVGPPLRAWCARTGSDQEHQQHAAVLLSRKRMHTRVPLLPAYAMVHLVRRSTKVAGSISGEHEGCPTTFGTTAAVVFVLSVDLPTAAVCML